MSPFSVLGVKANCDLDTAKKAYRKLAMEHHPDRGGNEKRFKEVQSAWDQIERGYREGPHRDANGHTAAERGFTSGFTAQRPWSNPESPGNTWRDRPADNIFDEFEKVHRPRQRNQREFVARVTIREAFSGFNFVIPRNNKGQVHDDFLGAMSQTTVNISPGRPHNHRAQYVCNDGSIANIITRIEGGDFKLRGVGDQDNLFSAGLNIGDIEIEREIEALDLITGTWITVQDFLGEKLQVRVPAGFNPLHRLKLAGKGYYGWNPLGHEPTKQRMDMYIKLNAVFNKPEDIERQKILDLYATIQNQE